MLAAMSESDAANKNKTQTDKTLGERFARTPDEMTSLRSLGVKAAKRMLAFIDASPTPYHAAGNVARQLEEDGFEQLDERDAWTLSPGDRRYVIRDAGTLVAFVVGSVAPATAGFRIIGAHTDSPCLMLKPQPEKVSQGYQQLGVEVYGGALLNPWFDRDLSIAGRVTYADAKGALRKALVDFREPVAVVPSLAIHLDREVNKSRSINAQTDIVPILGIGEELDLRALLADVVAYVRPVHRGT